MSFTNKFKPHIHILPEDSANRQLANGFILDIPAERQVKILPVAKGWAKVIQEFRDNQVEAMKRLTGRYVILLLDFDSQYKERIKHIRESIPEELTNRVFVLGAAQTPEKLKSCLNKSYEAIGGQIARACQQDDDSIWQHEMLRHNLEEVQRLKKEIRPILFPEG